MPEFSVAELAKKTYLVPSQKRQIQESIRHLNFMMRDPETREVAVPNTDRLASNLQKDEQMLADGTPPEYDSITKNKLNRLRLKLETDIQHGMPTADMMEKPTPNNIDLHIWWERENVQRVAAWKAVCRTLDPNNEEPNFTSIARLRPSTPPVGNPRKYWQNFDAVSWEEGIQEELSHTLDDAAYHAFLELKLLDWTKPGICKELGISPELYEVAMERLRISKMGQRTRDVMEQGIDDEEPEETHIPEETLAVPGHEKQTWIAERVRLSGMSLRTFATKYRGHAKTGGCGGYSAMKRWINGTAALSAVYKDNIETALADAEAKRDAKRLKKE